MDTPRRKLLTALVEGRSPISDIQERLRKVPWDPPDDERVTLTRDIAASVLRRALEGHLQLDELMNWADAIEVREDISFEEPYRETLRDIVFEVANPVLEGALTIEKIKGLLNRLQEP
jgi:hypothetical protein